MAEHSEECFPLTNFSLFLIWARRRNGSEGSRRSGQILVNSVTIWPKTPLQNMQSLFANVLFESVVGILRQWKRFHSIVIHSHSIQLYLRWRPKLEKYSHLFAYLRQRHPTPVLSPGKSHGWRSLVGCSPWGRENSRTQLRNFTFTFHFHALEREMATHSSVLAWRIQGRWSLVGCHLWGCTELDTTEVT